MVEFRALYARKALRQQHYTPTTVSNACLFSLDQVNDSCCYKCAVIDSNSKMEGMRDRREGGKEGMRDRTEGGREGG